MGCGGKHTISRTLTILVATVALAGCSSMSRLLGDAPATPQTTATAEPSGVGITKGSGVAPDLAAADNSEPVADLYNKGLAKLNAGEYRAAAKQFEEVERQHPYSGLATKAILMTAYAQYQRNSYEDAINAAQRFITLHPGHKDTPYAYYLVALSYYEQIMDVKRDQSVTQNALSALEEVGRRFPGSTYAQDAEGKAVLARDHLAGKEMEVGRYYLKKRAYVAAINRFKSVIVNYQTTSQTPEALYRLTEAYYSLGVQSEAQTAAAVLGHNYPSSQWYKDAYSLLASGGIAPAENTESWISKAIRKVTPF
ncbi:MAG TPA: outer membrane protein assembly factor BamD [Allosphingosinicella sp.]|nr:outer membrane protein assembly factor BamD [Allosphingosinicella sp.]